MHISGVFLCIIQLWMPAVRFAVHCHHRLGPGCPDFRALSRRSGVRVCRQAYVAGLYCSVQWIFSSFLVVVPVELWNCGAVGGRSSYVSLFLRTSGALTGTGIQPALQSVVCSLVGFPALGAGPLPDVLYRWRNSTGDVMATEGPFCSLGNAGEQNRAKSSAFERSKTLASMATTYAVRLRRSWTSFLHGS